MISEKRLFTDDELETMSKDFMGLAMEALEGGDVEGAKHWIRRHDETKDVIHDLYLHWITALLSHIHENWGEEAAVKAVRDTAAHGQSGWAIPMAQAKQKIIEEQGMKAYVEWVIDMWRQHSMYPGTTVEEDDEKVIIRMRQCGSGGRLINSGAYDGPMGYKKLEKAGCHTWGEQGLPIYCSHCPMVHEIAPVQYFGRGAQFWVHASPLPEKKGDPCILHIYKDPDDIPESYYERIGMSTIDDPLPPTFGVDPEKDCASSDDGDGSLR